MTINRDYRSSKSVAPLYRDDELMAELKMDINGFVSVNAGHAGNSITFDEWHRRELTWSIPAMLTSDGIDDLISEVFPLLEKIHKLHIVVWNGSNYAGQLKDEGEMIYQKIQETIDDFYNYQYLEVAEIWPALEAFDGEIDTLRVEYREMIEMPGGKDKFIEKLRESVREEKVVLVDIDDLIEELEFE